MIPFYLLFDLLGKSQHSTEFTTLLGIPPSSANSAPKMYPTSTWERERYTTYQSYRESLLIHVIDDIIQAVSFFPKDFDEGEECCYKGYDGIILDKICITDNRATVIEKFGEPFSEEKSMIGYLIDNNRYNLSFIFYELGGPNEGRNYCEIKSVNIGNHEFCCYPYTQIVGGDIWRSLWLTPF